LSKRDFKDKRGDRTRTQDNFKQRKFRKEFVAFCGYLQPHFETVVFVLRQINYPKNFKTFFIEIVLL